MCPKVPSMMLSSSFVQSLISKDGGILRKSAATEVTHTVSFVFYCGPSMPNCSILGETRARAHFAPFDCYRRGVRHTTRRRTACVPLSRMSGNYRDLWLRHTLGYYERSKCEVPKDFSTAEMIRWWRVSSSPRCLFIHPLYIIG